jgi:effector-binding domain-containing protein
MNKSALFSLIPLVYSLSLSAWSQQPPPSEPPAQPAAPAEQPSQVQRPSMIQGGMDEDNAKKYKFQTQVKTLPTQKMMFTQIQAQMGEEPLTLITQNIGKVKQYIESKGQTPVGRPFFRVLRVDQSAGQFYAQVGWFVKAPIQASKDILASEIPGGKVVYLPANGYPNELKNSSLLKANGIFQQYLKDNHYLVAGAAWIVVLTPPGTPANKMKIDSYVPIR